MEDYRKICIITNIGTHYRLPIFKEIEKNFSCAFYIGDHIQESIKTFNYSELKGYKKTVKNKFLSSFYWQKGTVSLINENYQYYILDGEPYCLSSWFILLLAKLKSKKTISWTHGWYGREGIIKKLIKKCFFNLFSTLMVYNEYAIHLMKEVGIPEKKMYCIANSLNSDYEKEIRSQLRPTDIYRSHFENSNPTIIYCGRIQKWKRLEMLIDAASNLKQQGISINLIFIGKDIDSVNIEKYATKQNLSDQIWMYGPCYDDLLLGELFYNANVCVSPGNIGLTAIHSLSFGCPIITHGNFPYQGPEFEAIRPGITGDFFQQGNIEDLARTIKKWINISSKEREKIRERCFDEIDRKWNIHHQIEVIKEVINGQDKNS
ncbi:MAG: glycosyltransferase [Prevotella sp.]